MARLLNGTLLENVLFGHHELQDKLLLGLKAHPWSLGRFSAAASLLRAADAACVDKFQNGRGSTVNQTSLKFAFGGAPLPLRQRTLESCALLQDSLFFLPALDLGTCGIPDSEWMCVVRVCKELGQRLGQPEDWFLVSRSFVSIVLVLAARCLWRCEKDGIATKGSPRLMKLRPDTHPLSQTPDIFTSADLHTCKPRLKRQDASKKHFLVPIWSMNNCFGPAVRLFPATQKQRLRRLRSHALRVHILDQNSSKLCRLGEHEDLESLPSGIHTLVGEEIAQGILES